MVHGKALAVVVAYDFYLECAEGKLRPEWKVNKPVSFQSFRETLAVQMLEYNPKKRLYLGDDKYRVSTQEHTSRRVRPSSATTSSSSSTGPLSVDSFTNPGVKSRLCGDLRQLQEHLRSLRQIQGKQHRICVVCGLNCSHECVKCGVFVHPKPTKHHGTACFMQYHSTAFFGLCKSDHKLVGVKKSDWQYILRSRSKMSMPGLLTRFISKLKDSAKGRVSTTEPQLSPTEPLATLAMAATKTPMTTKK